jgi:hypothetical protein
MRSSPRRVWITSTYGIFARSKDKEPDGQMGDVIREAEAGGVAANVQIHAPIEQNHSNYNQLLWPESTSGAC